MSKRLFVALDLPPSVRQALAALDPHLSGLRWLRPEQIHLTLSFLGPVKTDDESVLREKLALIRFQPFFLPVVGLGTFPARGPVRVLWAGVGSGHPQLFHLHQRIQDAALAAGLEPDLRAWQPHLTLARARALSQAALGPFLKKHQRFDAGLVPISAFTLYSSRPGGDAGSVYAPELEVAAQQRS